MTTFHFLPDVGDKLTWFKDSPNTGDPACLCSWCGKLIEEGELPVRAWRRIDRTELRLHIACAQKTIVEFSGGRQLEAQHRERSEFTEGKAAFQDGRRRASNPYSGKAVQGPAWYAGWDEGWEEAHARGRST